ncbi:hypothetical protein IAE23_25715 [Bacillus sp. S35]|nr:hypothetical protein [Bacillus sp. S35]
MSKEQLFKQIVEEAKKKIIDPVMWILRFQFDIVDGITHEEYVKAVAERYKYNQQVMKWIHSYLELWECEEMKSFLN